MVYAGGFFDAIGHRLLGGVCGFTATVVTFTEVAFYMFIHGF